MDEEDDEGTVSTGSMGVAGVMVKRGPGEGELVWRVMGGRALAMEMEEAREWVRELLGEEVVVVGLPKVILDGFSFCVCIYM